MIINLLTILTTVAQI